MGLRRETRGKKYDETENEEAYQTTKREHAEREQFSLENA